MAALQSDVNYIEDILHLLGKPILQLSLRLFLRLLLNVNMKKVSVEMHGSKNVILDFKISDRIKCGQGKSPPIPCPASLTPAATCEGNHFFMDISSDMAKLPLNGGGKSLTSTIIYGNG